MLTTRNSAAGVRAPSTIERAPDEVSARPVAPYNRFGPVLDRAHAIAKQTVLHWLNELFGLPVEWVGSRTTGASTSYLAGLAAKRQWTSVRLGFDAARDGLAGHPLIPVIASQ